MSLVMGVNTPKQNVYIFVSLRFTYFFSFSFMSPKIWAQKTRLKLCSSGAVPTWTTEGAVLDGLSTFCLSVVFLFFFFLKDPGPNTNEQVKDALLPVLWASGDGIILMFWDNLSIKLWLCSLLVQCVTQTEKLLTVNLRVMAFSHWMAFLYLDSSKKNPTTNFPRQVWRLELIFLVH